MGEWTARQIVNGGDWLIYTPDGRPRCGCEHASAAALWIEDLRELDRLRAIVEPIDALLEDTHAVLTLYHGAVLSHREKLGNDRWYSGDTRADALAKAIAATREAAK